ncbi:MAG: endonuclease/exonuclease/phosphatase family protein [bacterium]
MSFNLRYDNPSDGENAWAHRKPLVLGTIGAAAPDLLGVQECLPSQARFLRAWLEGYGFLGVGREDGAPAERTSSEMCAIFYRSDRFEKLDEGFFWLSETPAVAGSNSWDSALPRMVSWVRLRDRRDPAVTFHFVNTHFDHLGVEARRQSAVMLRRQIRDLCRGGPAILVGDFNAPADPAVDEPFGLLINPDSLADPVLLDSYRALHPASDQEGTFNGFDGATTGPRIDWILTTTTFRTVRADIIRSQQDGRYPSDHFPVTATVQLTN